ncbi:hypothetical protein [Roseibium sp. TrichSKD4]|uniref:hypothetical protein n=1 Tax=Roseibium sp. TrichSKD4 TaxID=744980 RepID=UPI000590AE69|nr:hypothetical protein [Roseibium sp. TrichSKD4]
MKSISKQLLVYPIIKQSKWHGIYRRPLMVACRTLLAKASPKETEYYAGRIRLVNVNGNEIEKLCKIEQNIVFAAFHFSSMFNLMWAIDKLIPREIPIHCIAATGSRSWREARLWNTFAETREAHLWSLEKAGALKSCVKMCRKMPGVVICFSDLPGRFGATQDCRLLGRPARLSAGVLRLRAILKARMMVGHARGNVLDRSAPEFTLLVEYSADEQVRMTELSYILGREISAHPLEWRNWFMFMAYFQPSNLDRN